MMGPTVAGEDQAMSELHEKHRVDLERLTLTSRPFKTLAFFVLAIAQSLGTTCSSVLKKASVSGRKTDELEELDDSVSEGFLSLTLHQAKHWLMSHSQHLNFTTILLLASVLNPLFDLAGILCGQFNIPFWKFFLATLIGKAIVKVCIQTTLVITLCNNQLLDLVEKRVIWAFGNVPGVASVLPSVVAKLRTTKNKFLSAHVAALASIAVKGKKVGSIILFDLEYCGVAHG